MQKMSTRLNFNFDLKVTNLEVDLQQHPEIKHAKISFNLSTGSSLCFGNDFESPILKIPAASDSVPLDNTLVHSFASSLARRDNFGGFITNKSLSIKVELYGEIETSFFGNESPKELGLVYEYHLNLAEIFKKNHLEPKFFMSTDIICNNNNNSNNNNHSNNPKYGTLSFSVRYHAGDYSVATRSIKSGWLAVSCGKLRRVNTSSSAPSSSS